MRYHKTKLDVHRKDGNEPVTRADRESSDLILKGLRAEFPDDIHISEEEPDNDARQAADRVWFVDPLDGTKDFVRGEDGFSVMIGLNIEGRPKMGVVYQPIGDRLYTSEPTLGAAITDADGQRSIHVSSVSDPTGIRLVASKSHRDHVLDSVKNALGITNELNIGSVGLKLGKIAHGDRDLYVSAVPYTKCWDSCAPEAILHAAGGKLSDLWGQPLVYTAVALNNAGGLLASNGLVHDAVVEKLAPLFPGNTLGN